MCHRFALFLARTMPSLLIRVGSLETVLFRFFDKVIDLFNPPSIVQQKLALAPGVAG
jgi:hypothetical protein